MIGLPVISRALRLTLNNVAEQFALTEISFVIVRMAQRFEKIETSSLTEQIPKGLRLTLVPRNGVRVRLFQALNA